MIAAVEHSSAGEFADKWRALWPEWTIAEAFVPAVQRTTAVAWFALLHELAEAAWGGADPTPGLAKLAWWQEELRGWAKGARRHPLGSVLQPQPAPWTALADALGMLRQRALPAEPAQGSNALRPFTTAAAHVEAALFGVASAPDALAVALLAPAAITLDSSSASVLEAALPAAAGARVSRLFGALLRLRLAQAARGTGWVPVARWRSVWPLWAAARRG